MSDTTAARDTTAVPESAARDTAAARGGTAAQCPAEASDTPATRQTGGDTGTAYGTLDGSAPRPTGFRSGERPVLAASDLDRTLIYSAAALALDMPDEQAPRLLCVEVYQHKPLSYMTERAAGLLRALADEAVFVPATTRTREQYRRIALPGPVPPFAICANGGHLLVDGRTDHDWNASVRKRLADRCAPLAEICAHLATVADPEWLLKERVAEDLFAYLVVERGLLPGGWVEELAGWADERGWTVSLQGRKVYAVPKPLTKSAALTEVVGRSGVTSVLAAGDSLLDTDLLLAADRAWRPGHGELAETGWTAPEVTVLDSVGVAAGEEILRRMWVRAQSVATV